MSTVTTQPMAAPPKPTWGQRIAAFFKALIRLILWLLFLLLLLAGCAATIVWGVPYVERTYLRPVQEMQVKVDVLERGLQSLEQRLTDQEEATASAIQALTQRVQELEGQLQALQDDLDELRTAQEEQTQRFTQDVRDLESKLTSIQSQIDRLEEDLQALTEENAGLAQTLRLESQIQVRQLQVLLHISQARVAIAQQDLTLAQDEISRARGLLQDLIRLAGQAERDDAWFEAVQEGQTRLEYAYDKVLTQPDLALKDLDIAWVVLTQAFEPQPVAVPEEAATEAEQPGAEEAATESPEAAASPTPTPTPAPSP
ncbi:MAG: hypothetical protein GXO36_04080 [Chloroflexi bacterium]|nr:hypothetical protein [Chloroflexota bacterium]